MHGKDTQRSGSGDRAETEDVRKYATEQGVSEQAALVKVNADDSLGDSNLLRRNGEMRQTCAHCQAEIVDGHWFCRLPGNEAPVLLCCPSCALRYFDRLRPEANGSDHKLNSCEHRLHFFANGELWS